MPSPKPILVSEWLAELARLQPKGADGFTRRDVERVLGLGEHAAGVRLRSWEAKGHIEFAGKRPAMTIDGRPLQLPVYRLKPKAKRSTR